MYLPMKTAQISLLVSLQRCQIVTKIQGRHRTDTAHLLDGPTSSPAFISGPSIESGSISLQHQAVHAEPSTSPANSHQDPQKPGARPGAVPVGSNLTCLYPSFFLPSNILGTYISAADNFEAGKGAIPIALQNFFCISHVIIETAMICLTIIPSFS